MRKIEQSRCVSRTVYQGCNIRKVNDIFTSSLATAFNSQHNLYTAGCKAGETQRQYRVLVLPSP